MKEHERKTGANYTSHIPLGRNSPNNETLVYGAERPDVRGQETASENSREPVYKEGREDKTEANNPKPVQRMEEALDNDKA